MQRNRAMILPRGLDDTSPTILTKQDSLMKDVDSLREPSHEMWSCKRQILRRHHWRGRVHTTTVQQTTVQNCCPTVISPQTHEEEKRKIRIVSFTMIFWLGRHSLSLYYTKERSLAVFLSQSATLGMSEAITLRRELLASTNQPL